MAAGFAWLGLVALGMWSLLDSPPSWTLHTTRCPCFSSASRPWHALAGRETDLVEARRRLRVVLAGFDGVVRGGAHRGRCRVPRQLSVRTLQHRQRRRPRHEDARHRPVVARHRHEASAVFSDCFRPAVLAAPRGTPRQAPWISKRRHFWRALRELMEQQKLHRHDGLTIAVLAARLAIPEYRPPAAHQPAARPPQFQQLRQRLPPGEARAALADPVQAKVPILTIALDTGFQSLAPFNRAFKMTAGMTPRE